MTHSRAKHSAAQPQARDEWMPLDNAAHIYPAARSRNWTALFRVSMELTEPIEPDALERALSRTLRRFPAYGMRLRYGLFWHYFERIAQPPAIQKDVQNPCVRMDLRENNGYMFRVRCHENRIAVEIFHALSDGTGGMCFLKTLVAEYLRLKYGAQIPFTDEILNCDEEARPEELEDSFLRYARSVPMSRGESRAYPLRGTHEPEHVTHVITGLLSADAVKERAKEFGATVSELLTALLILAIRRVQQKEHSRKRRVMPVKICVPVNMRKFYGSRTMRNFASYVNPGIEPVYGEYTLEETISAVRHYMGLMATEKQLNAKFTTNVLSVRNNFLRATPLFLKNPTLRLMFRLTGDRQTSGLFSNLGNSPLPPAMQTYVKRTDFLVGPLRYNPVTCACVSNNGLMCINFCRVIREAEVERNFFTSLVRLGLHVRVESNRAQNNITMILR